MVVRRSRHCGASDRAGCFGHKRLSDGFECVCSCENLNECVGLVVAELKRCDVSAQRPVFSAK